MDNMTSCKHKLNASVPCLHQTQAKDCQQMDQKENHWSDGFEECQLGVSSFVVPKLSVFFSLQSLNRSDVGDGTLTVNKKLASGDCDG